MLQGIEIISNKKTTRIVTVITTVTILVTLFACMAADDDDEPYNTELSEAVYVSEYISLPRDIGNIGNFTFYNEKFYFTISRIDYPNISNNFLSDGTSLVYVMNSDGSGYTEFAGYAPPAAKTMGIGGFSQIHSIIVDNEGILWVIESWDFYTLTLPAAFDFEKDEWLKYRKSLDSGYVLRGLALDGTELYRIEINNINDYKQYSFPEKIAVQSITYNDEKYVYISSTDLLNNMTLVSVLDIEGNIRFSHTFLSSGVEFIQISGNDSDVIIVDDSGRMYTVDFTKDTLVEITIPQESNITTSIVDNAEYIHYHNGNNDYIMLVDNHKDLYGVRREDNEIIWLLNWNDSSINIDYVTNVIMLPDNKIVCLNENHQGYAPKTELIILTQIPRSQLPDSILITLAGLGISLDIQDAVYDFNLRNQNINIEIIDYLQSDETWLMDYERLMLDITTGNVPDILAVNELPLFDLQRNGLFVDLYSYIDTDPELSRNDFMQAPLRAAETNGSLYRMFTSFSIMTIIGNSNVLGVEMGWDLDDFQSVLDANSMADIPIGDGITGEIFLRYDAITASINDFVDFEANIVNFDSEHFINFLELSKRITENTVSWDNYNFCEREDAVSSGRQIMVRDAIFGFSSLQQYKALFGEDLVFKGFPTSTKNGHMYINFYNSISITTGSGNKEAAWSFVRTFLDKYQQIDYAHGQFPSNQAAFDQYCTELLIYNEDYTGTNNQLTETLTQADIDMIINLINTTTLVRNPDTVLQDIIIESAEDYFNNLISVQDAARIIQDRVSKYLSERN